MELCNGDLVYRDYVYDDYGADTGAVGALSTGSLSNPSGDVRYPGPDPDNNYADLVELRLRIVDGQLHVRIVLNSMTRADSTLAVLAIDTDDDPLTGGGPWPFLSTNGVPLTSTGWDEAHAFSVGDPATNSIEGSIALPPGSRWRLQAATAIAASGVVMNVAFRGSSESGNWFEDAQAAALATGNVSAFGHTVEVADLLGGVTQPAVVPAGYHERVYTSDFTVALDRNGRLDWTSGAEGVHYAGIPGRGEGPAFGQEFHFLGRNQPYGISIPSGAPPHGVQLVMHGYGANHASLINQPGMQQNVGEARNRILVRVPHPERVTYRMEPFLWDDVLGILHDRAYWVSDLRGHWVGENDYVDVDVRTFGCGSDVPRSELDPPGAGTDPVPWESQSASVVGFDPIVQANRIEAALANVQSLTLDTSSTAGACLGPAPIEYQVTTDAPVTVAFSDGRVLTLPGPGTHAGSVGPLDSDQDGIPDDGDGSNVAGDASCAGGETSGCDDNCPTTTNPGQADADGDAIGDDCDRCPRRPTPPKRCR